MQIKGSVGQGSVRAGFSGGYNDCVRIVVTGYQTRYDVLSLYICSFLCKINSNAEDASIVIGHHVPVPFVLLVHILNKKNWFVFS